MPRTNDGHAGGTTVERADGTRDELTGTAKTEMHPGDVFVIQTPAGGGYGKAGGKKAGE